VVIVVVVDGGGAAVVAGTVSAGRVVSGAVDPSEAPLPPHATAAIATRKMRFTGVKLAAVEADWAGATAEMESLVSIASSRLVPPG